jgi:class 3 adenylate cyclase
MKSGETMIAERFSGVTVLFADIVGFTELSQRMRPERLVQLLNVMFSVIDRITGKYNVEKIKTIGDCYMIASGVPAPDPQGVETMARVAWELVEAMKEFENDSSRSKLSVRVGMHMGDVVAGVIGTKKFTYDLWGDTVNVASRMESHGAAGKIHCTEDVYEALKYICTFEERGAIEVKGRGLMRTYFLTGFKAFREMSPEELAQFQIQAQAQASTKASAHTSTQVSEPVPEPVSAVLAEHS